MLKAGGLWEPSSRRWLIEPRRIGPLVRNLRRVTDPLFRQAGISLDDAPGGVEGEMPPFWGVAASFVHVLFRLVVYAPAESSGRWLLLGRNMGQTGHIRDRLLLGPVRRWRNCRGITSLKQLSVRSAS
jgi:hypothetical protein